MACRELTRARNEGHILLGRAIAPEDLDRVNLPSAGIGECPSQCHQSVLEHSSDVRGDPSQDSRNISHRERLARDIHMRAVLIHQRDVDGRAALIHEEVRDLARHGEHFNRTAITPRNTVLRHRVRSRIAARTEHQPIERPFVDGRRTGQRQRRPHIRHRDHHLIRADCGILIRGGHRQRVSPVVQRRERKAVANSLWNHLAVARNHRPPDGQRIIRTRISNHSHQRDRCAFPDRAVGSSAHRRCDVRDIQHEGLRPDPAIAVVHGDGHGVNSVHWIEMTKRQRRGGIESIERYESRAITIIDRRSPEVRARISEGN